VNCDSQIDLVNLVTRARLLAQHLLKCGEIATSNKGLPPLVMESIHDVRANGSMEKSQEAAMGHALVKIGLSRYGPVYSEEVPRGGWVVAQYQEVVAGGSEGDRLRLEFVFEGKRGGTDQTVHCDR
jgi:hypothetical protein